MDEGRPSLRTKLRPGWYRILERSPRLYTAYRRKRQPGATVVTANCDVVVVGYPACANTFARIAFLHANPGLTVASHAHSWTQVAAGTRLHLPTVVLVRDPIAAVSSVLVRSIDLRPRWELENYARLYRRTVPFLNQVVVADFGEVTSRFGDVIRRVNERFGMSFAPFAHDDPGATAAVLAEIEAYDRTQFGDATGIRTARPSPEKDEEKVRIRPLLEGSELQPLVHECDRLYRILQDRAEG